jgi:hypothetical protein
MPYAIKLPGTLAEAAACRQLYFVKTHDRVEADDSPAIYIYRDGRASLASYAWHHLRQGRRLADAEISRELYLTTLRDLLLEMRSPFGLWSENVDSWFARPRTVHLRFEDLIRNPGLLIPAVQGLGLGLMSDPNAEIPPFSSLQTLNPCSFARGKPEAWRQDFTPELLDLFYDHQLPTLRRLGYVVDGPAARCA